MNELQTAKRRKATDLNDETLMSMTKEELIAQIRALHAHNAQLKNIISRNKASEKATSNNKRTFDFSKCHFRHILLKFLYLGWNYQGFAVQEDSNNTIERYLFEALTKTCLIKSRNESNYHRCGRTDKGVSSFGQVISITVRSKFSKNQQTADINNELNYCKMLNRVLPVEIRCTSWQPVEETFSARFDCDSRTYKYFFPKSSLNITAMKEASNYLIGEHDFRNLCKMDVANGVTSFIRSISKIDIESLDRNLNDDFYTLYSITIVAKAFLWHQIRCIMGVLFLIGQNKENPSVVKELLDVETNPRKPNYNMASEVPLNLFYSEYVGKSENWLYDKEALEEVSQTLQKFWTEHAIKTVMIRTMLEVIEKDVKKCNFNVNCDKMIDFLIQGVKAKVYVPLMKRPTCDSLEERIVHYSKRGKFQSNASSVLPAIDEIEKT